MADDLAACGNDLEAAAIGLCPDISDVLVAIAADPDKSMRPAEEEGWLVFRSGRERRRQRPIPPDWGKMSDGDLRGLLHVARPSGPRSRMV